MKLSMWILAEWMKRFSPEVHIENGEAVLRGVRILSETITPERQNVYITTQKSFLKNQDMHIICVHERDMLIFNTFDIDEIFNAVLDAFDFYNGWFMQLEEIIEKGNDLQALSDQSEKAFLSPFLIYSADNKMIAYSKGYAPENMNGEWKTVIETGYNSFEFWKTAQTLIPVSKTIIKSHNPELGYHSYIRELCSDGISVGQIVLLETQDSPEEHVLQQLLDVFGYIVEKWKRKHDRQNTLRHKTDIFADIITQRPFSQDSLDYTLMTAGWHPTDEKVLCQLMIPEPYKHITELLRSKIEQNLEHAFVFFCNDYIYILYNTALNTGQLKNIIRSYLNETFFICIQSYPFTNIGQLKQYADQCQLVMECIPYKKGFFYCKDYALTYIKKRISSMIDSCVKHPALETLRQEDIHNGRELTKTLYSFLQNQGSIVETAQSMHVHKNTILYRLNQIKEFTDIDLNNIEEREYLYLSFLLK